MNWKIIINPFSKIPEIQLLVFGIILLILGSFIGYYFEVSYDGIFDVHISKPTFWESFLENSINVVSLLILLFVLGKLINSKTRIIDIVNISLVSRFPIYILGLFANNSKMNEISEKLIENIDHPEKLPIDTGEMIFLLMFSFVSLWLLAYFIILLVNGFRTATNIKKWQYWILFLTVLIIAEFISKFLINQL